MTAFLKTTMLGGVLFLLPFAIVLMVLGYALGLASKVAQPISEKLQLDDWGTLPGLGLSLCCRLWCWSCLPSPPALSPAPIRASA